MSLPRYEATFQKIVFELRPYLKEVVVIGGWVPYLYKRYGGFTDWRSNTSLTVEVDVLVDHRLPTNDRLSLPEILRAAGFHPTDGEAGSAVWEGDVQAGEKIEFLVPHRGTGRQQGRIVSVKDQGEMSAIPLQGLDLLHRFTRTLPIPVFVRHVLTNLDVRVPALGAYVVNKASTFAARTERGGGEPKRAKDLLYLRDLSAAGPEIVERIESDLAEMVGDRNGRRLARERIRHAGNHLDLALTGALRRTLPEVARMLAEREPSFETDAALADIRGHLTDLREVLEVHAG